MNMPRARHNIPKMPTREIVDNELQDAYRRFQFTPSDKCITISSLFGDVAPLLEETIDFLLHEQNDFKVCSHLELEMVHKVGEVESVESIHFILKTQPL